jgi:hypothetical protein
MSWSTTSAPWWSGLADTALDGAVNIFGQKINADASVSSSRNVSASISGVVKFVSVIAGVFAVIAVLMKIFK